MVALTERGWSSTTSPCATSCSRRGELDDGRRRRLPRRAGGRGAHRGQPRVPRPHRPRQGDPPAADRDRHRASSPRPTTGRSTRQRAARRRRVADLPDLAAAAASDGFTRIKEMLWPTMERIETLQRSGKAITGVPSGFVDLDGLTSGFQRAELVDRRGPALDGQDGVLPQHRRPTRRRGARASPSSRWKCPRRRWCSACSRADGAGGQPAGAAGHAARLRLHQAGARGRHAADAARSGSTTRRPSRCWRCAPRRGGSRPTTTCG